MSLRDEGGGYELVGRWGWSVMHEDADEIDFRSGYKTSLDWLEVSEVQC